MFLDKKIDICVTVEEGPTETKVGSRVIGFPIFSLFDTELFRSHSRSMTRLVKSTY